MEQKKTNPNSGLRALVDELYALASKKVAGAIASITGAAPIVITGTPGHPNVTISPATDLAPGSMSAADKAKLDGISPGAAAAATFVFQPGGVAAGNVYTTWPALYAALNVAAPISSKGMRPPTTIQIDDSFVSPAVMPPGAYNLDSAQLETVASFANIEGGGELQISDGATLVFGAAGGQLSFERGLKVTYVGAAAPCVSVSGSQEVNFYIFNGIDLECTGAGPFVQATGGFCYFRASGVDGIIGDGTHPVLTATVPSVLQLDLNGSIIARPNAITGAGTLVHYDVQNIGAQGAGVVVSQNIGFTADVPGNWAGLPPTQMSQAINRIAANTTNAHPIP